VGFEFNIALPRYRVSLLATLLAAVINTYPLIAFGLDASKTIKQLHHTAWGPEQGAPSGGIKAMAQTADGYLWIVSPSGLFRFDGITFERMALPSDKRLASTAMHALYASNRGALWVGFTFGGVARLEDDHWQVYSPDGGLPPGSPYRFAETADGTLWVITTGGLARFDGSKWQRVGAEMGFPPPNSSGTLYVDSEGTLWAVAANRIFRLRKDEHRFSEKVIPPTDRWTVAAVTGTVDGTVWLATGPGPQLRVIEHLASTPSEATLKTSAWVVPDHDGTLWVTTGQGLGRIQASELPPVGRAFRLADVKDKYSDIDGLTARSILALLIDHEGNLWVGTYQGLDRFSEPHLEAPMKSSDNLKVLPAIGGIGLASSDGTGGLWVSNAMDRLMPFKEGRLGPSVLNEEISCLLRGPDGTVWIASRGKFWQSHQGRFESLPSLDSSEETQALAIDQSGYLWASVVRSGVYQLKDGVWTAYGGIAALPRGPAITIARDRLDRLWFSYPGGTLAVLQGLNVRIYEPDEGPQLGNVLANYAGRSVQWFGGELGLARFDGARFLKIRSIPELPLEGITGIIETANGDLWLNSRAGIVHLPASELEQARQNISYLVRGESFGAFDGVVGTPDLRPLPTAIESGDGKLWFSTNAAFYSIAPAHQARNLLPPPVFIRTLMVGDDVLKPTPDMRLPERSTVVRFDYVGLSLTAADKNRYRYRLDGVDRDWRPITAARQALYTNLRPGRYTFHVIAANNDGVWNDQGTSLSFIIPAAFVQTPWFLALCVAGGSLAVWMLVRFRVRQVAARVQERLEERVAERERIARDLHDTLLQGVQGMIWRFQAVSDRIAPDQPARQLMEQSLDRADRLLAESRDKVKDLRPVADEVADLAQALASEGDQFAQLHPAKFQVNVQGSRRELHPIVREEGFLIAREAITNAFRHSAAKEIEVEITYGEEAFRIRIRDDGLGINAPIQTVARKSGHYGVVGMRERATKLGGHLEIWSKPEAGCEVDFEVPAKVAYRKSPKRTSSSHRFLALFRSS
jgi:signal transduction histidine kinase/ligand-binding sensor domain-containing protein